MSCQLTTSKLFPRKNGQHTTVGEIVKSVSENEIVDEDTDVSEAIKQMTKYNLGHLVVMIDHRIKGMITKTDVMNYIQFYTELH